MAMSPKIALILKGMPSVAHGGSGEPPMSMTGPGSATDQPEEPESDQLMAAHEMIKALREEDPESLLSALMVIIRGAGEESPEEGSPAEGPQEAP